MSLRLILSHTDELPDGPTEGGLPRSTGPSTSHSLPHSLHLLQEASQQCTATGNLQVSGIGLGGTNKCFLHSKGLLFKQTNIAFC